MCIRDSIWNDWIYGRTVLPAETLLAFQQMIIDSSSDTIGLEIVDEFVECYGGSTATVLRRGLRPKKGTRIRGNSNAGTSVPAYAKNSPPWDPYLSEKLTRLAAGDSYDEAVRKAQEAYRTWIRGLITTKHNLAEWYRGMLACMDAGSSAVCSLQYNGNWYWASNNASNRAKFRAKRDSLVADSTSEANHLAASGVIFKSRRMTEYCDTIYINVPPGDQIAIEFPESVSSGMNCGNITVWEDTASSPPPNKWVRRRIWNWNNPGSYGYDPANRRRVITTPSGGTGRYFIHNDNKWGDYPITIETRQQILYTDSPSNIHTYANASFGWNDSSMLEFNDLLIGETWYVDNAGIEDFDLSMLPAFICPRGYGIGELMISMGEMGDNEFWRDMELWLNILDVPFPGQLHIIVEGAEFPDHILFIEGPGIYTVHLGQMGGFRKETCVYPVIIFQSDITVGASFAWDSWALRTLYDATVDIDEKSIEMKPQHFEIASNYPDPFNSTTIISFSLPEASQVKIDVLDVSGRLVFTPLSGGSFETGIHEAKIDMSSYVSGVYFVKISTEKYSAVERIMLIK